MKIAKKKYYYNIFFEPTLTTLGWEQRAIVLEVSIASIKITSLVEIPRRSGFERNSSL